MSAHLAGDEGGIRPEKRRKTGSDERLPFDRGEVVASHSAKVLRRLKVAEERETVEKWLKSMEPAAAER